MKKKTMRLAGAVMTVAALLAFSPSASAIEIDVDTVLADDPSITTTDASVQMELAGNVLTIILRNALSGGPAGANGLLTGIAFDLPGTYDIVSGSVAVATGSSIRGGVMDGAGAGTDVSGEWGFNNVASGHFNGLAVDTQVSAMTADAGTTFSNASIEPPSGLNGPEFGLLGPGGDRGGLTAIEDSVIITLTLANQNGGVPNGGFLSGIDGGIVAVTYGSPTGTTVPDASTTAMLLGVALLGLEGLRRRMAK